MFNNFGGPLREADSVPDDRRRLRPPHEAAILVRRVRVTYRAHTIDAIVVVMMQSKSRGGVGATSTGGAAPDACAMPGRNAPARKDDRKKENLDHADLLFAEILETCDMSARRFPLNRPRRFWLRPREWPGTD